MKETGKLLIKELLITVICAIMGVAALCITYFIPQEDMYDNVKESAIILHNEGLGKHVWENISETMLDVYTDGLMVNVAYTETDDGIRDILLDTYVEVERNTHGINPMESLYEMVAVGNDNYHIKNYGRYWHGYQIILRPLLCFFTYADIRQINMILQLALVFVFVYILARSEDRMLLVPFWGMYIFLSPVSLFSSFQYSPCFYIMMLALIAVFAFKKYMNDVKRNYLFLLVGILTTYFDLLTYPLITLAVPLLALLGSDQECMTSLKKGIKNTVFYTVSWGIGYVGMWALKWIIASVFTEENVIGNAIEQLKIRSGHFSHKQTWLDTVKININVCNIKVLIIIFLCVILFILGNRIKKRQRINIKMLPCVGVVLLVSAYPFIWYYLAMEHSSCHAHFTWRELAISVFGIIMVGVINCKKKDDYLGENEKIVTNNDEA